MTTKCSLLCLWIQLFTIFVLWNFIKCDCPFPRDEITNGEYLYVKPFHAKRINAKETYLLWFRCSAGYELIGRNPIQCYKGKWSHNVPSCKAMLCGAPPRIGNGTYTLNVIDTTEVQIGTQAIYSCNPGYELSDPSVSNLTCILNEDGDKTLWDGEIPACKAMKPCPKPGVSKNGSREGNCCLPGDIVSYSCNEGFEIVGEQDLECLLSSKWSSLRPLCRPLAKHCELPPKIPNGVVIPKSGDYALAKEEVRILCEPGYKVNATNEIPYCNSSALWQDEFGECVEAFCNRPKPLENGNIPELNSDFNDTFPYNFVITYDCNEGYRLKKGEPWAFCGTDGWSFTDPQCEEIFCPLLDNPKHGSKEGDSIKVGARVRFKCSTGYDLVGSFESFCKSNGKWTGELARCNAPTNHCPNPGIPINGIKEGENYGENDTVIFSCKPGFIHTGSKERTCMNDGTWNGTETICLGPYDYDSTEEIGDNLKYRLSEKFDEDMREYRMSLSARGIGAGNLKALQVPAQGRLFMYFAFDVSGSITKPNFKKGIEFAKALVEQIGVSEDGTRVGAMTFSSVPHNVFFPMDYTTKEEVFDQLDAIEYTGGGTAASSALEKMKENIILVEKREKNVTKSVLFLVTDGKANMGGNPEIEAKILKKMNVEIFCIGITGDVRADILYTIASTSKYGNEEKPNVFILKSYERLSWLIEDISRGTIDYSKCGIGMESKMNNIAGKMMGGEISIEPWPWMAALFFRDLKHKEKNPTLQCGGSVINQKFILTAAHCLFEKKIKNNFRERSKEEILVKLGLLELANETIVQEFQVKNFYIHEDFSFGRNYDNDIALLELDDSITYNPFLRPVCLPPAVPSEDNNLLYKPGENGWVIGWGHEKPVSPIPINPQYRLSKKLKELRMPIQSTDRCKSSINRKKTFTERMFCAGDGVSGNDTCRGDSGGPFMQPHINSEGKVYWTQVGVVSWGVGCGQKGNYGFYTHVQRFLPWIDQKIKESALEGQQPERLL